MGGRIYVKASVNGSKPYLFALGTMGGSYISNEIATDMQLPTRELVSGQKSYGLSVSENTRLTVGTRTFSDEQFKVSDLSVFREQFGVDEMEGMIGTDILRKNALVIEFPKKTLYFDENDERPKPEVATAIPFEVLFDLPVVTAHLDGVNAKILIDINHPEALSLTPRFASANSSRKHGGKIVLTPSALQVDRFILGPKATLTSLNATLLPSPDDTSSDPGIDGILGAQALQNFNVILDYPKHELWLITPPAETKH
jgi:hypothetical protein